MVRVRVRAGSAREAVDALGDLLVVRVCAPPVKGRANEAARRLLASVLHLPVSQVELLHGAAARDKQFLLRGVPPEHVVDRVVASERRAD